MDEDTGRPVLGDLQLKKSGRSAFRGEAISLDTEEELFYIPKRALYDNNMWQTETLGQSGPSGPSGPSGASGQSWTPIPPGARLVTWRPDMNKKKQKTEAPYRPAYQPYTAARSRIVTWVPEKMKVADGGGGGGGGGGGYHGQAG